MYKDLIETYKSLIKDETDFFTNASNLNALIFEKIPDLNWVGFYMIDENELVLSTFQGKVACTRIKIGKGVCGTCAKLKKTLIVDNVHNFKGHIACDSASNSEITIPIIYDEKVIGVFDLDSPLFSRFNEEDHEGLNQLINILINKSNIRKLSNYYKFN